jgi:hypothetical protein
MPEEAFIPLCMKTGAEYKTKTLLKNAFWKCSMCKEQLPWSGYFLERKGKDWSVLYEERICRPGALRKCSRCSPNADDTETWKCKDDECGMEKPQSAYSSSQWHNRHDRGATCLECEKHVCYKCKLPLEQSAFSESQWHHRNERGTACLKCDKKPKAETHICCECNLPLEQSAFSDSQWHHRHKRGAACLECEKNRPVETCTLCRASLPASAYPEGMWHNKRTQNVRCNECCRPKCIRRQCKTCSICRDETCRKRKCTDAITTLHPKHFPGTIEERDQWLCLVCRFVVCRTCRKDMPRREQSRRAGTKSKTLWTCGDCLTLEESRRVSKKYS